MAYYSKNGKLTQTIEYRSWAGMIQRCTNPNNPKYDYYGGQGITVCDRWLNSYKYFLEDMGRKPSLDYSIDRIDISLGYFKDNCKWSTRAEQSRNRKSVKLNEEIVKEIRALYELGSTQKELTIKYNLPYYTIGRVVKNLQWKNIK